MPSQQAGRKEWIGLGVLALPTLLLSLDISVLFLAAPHLGEALQPSASQLLWILDIYGFMIAGLLITMGTLGDRIGRRKLLMIGAAAFSMASVAAAFSTSAGMLIVTRALLGIAGATLMPSTLALISNMFKDPQQRAIAIGVWMTCFLSGIAIGPVVGGVMLQYFWWGSVFLLGVPVMMLLLVTGPFLLPEYRDAKAGQLDLLSAALSLAAMLPIIYGIKATANTGFTPTSVVPAILGLIFGVLFVFRQQRLTHPLLDLHLFRVPAFSVALAVMLVVLMAVGGNAMFFAQYLQLVQGLSPWHAGVWMLPSAGAMIVGSLLAPVLAQRWLPGYVVGIGLLISGAGFLVLTQVGPASGFALLITGFVIAYFGLSPTMVLGTDLIIGTAPPEKAGAASAVSETGMEFGMALGIALLGSVGNAVYRHQMADAAPASASANMPVDIGGSFFSTLEAAEQMQVEAGLKLLAEASEAFTSGLHAAAGLSALMIVLLAGFSMIMLRHVRPSGEASSIADGG